MINLNYVSFVGENLPRTPSRVAIGVPRRSVQFLSDFPRRAHEVEHPPDPFVSWLLERAGVHPGTYRPGVLARRVPACLRSLRVGDPQAAQSLLADRPDLLSRAVSTVLLGVSEFFRDAPVFEALEKQVVPELALNYQQVRVLSVGCSEGQELYSMAMLLAECGALGKSTLVGVDCRPDAVSTAATALYGTNEIQAVPAHLRERYFCLVGNMAQVVPALRRRTSWRVADVLSQPAHGTWEVICFRNVSIYWKPQRAAQAQALLADSLAPGGIMVTGKAERLPAHLGMERIAPCIYKKPIS